MLFIKRLNVFLAAEQTGKREKTGGAKAVFSEKKCFYVDMKKATDKQRSNFSFPPYFWRRKLVVDIKTLFFGKDYMKII